MKEIIRFNMVILKPGDLTAGGVKSLTIILQAMPLILYYNYQMMANHLQVIGGTDIRRDIQENGMVTGTVPDQQISTLEDSVFNHLYSNLYATV